MYLCYYQTANDPMVDEHLVIWWLKQVHYTSHNNPFDSEHSWRTGTYRPFAYA